MARQLILKCSDNDYLNLESAACGDTGRAAALSGLDSAAAAVEVARRESLATALVLRLAIESAALHAIRMADQQINDQAQVQREQYAAMVQTQKEIALETATVTVEAVDE